MINCVNCESENVRRHDISLKGKVRYYCTSCSCTFTPNRSARGRARQIESQHQIALFRWAQFNPILQKHLFAIPNGGKRNLIEAKILKGQGVKSGVSDTFLAYPVKPYAGLWIELKSPKPYKSQITKNQQEWIDLMQSVGYDAYIAYGWEEAANKITSYLNLGKK